MIDMEQAPASRTLEGFKVDDKFTENVGDHAEAGAYAAASTVFTPEEERRYLRKLDIRLVSLLSAIYLCSFLDRSNIGNANTAGMSLSLGLTSNQFTWLLTIFYIPYILFEWCTLLWKVFPANYYVCVVVFFWGLVSALQAATQNWAGMMTLRFFLGVAEAAYGPGVPFFLSFFYHRHEMAFRSGLFFSSAPLASAFAGALAYGITSGHSKLENWRLLFLVEGFPTMLMAVVALFFLPRSAPEARFFNAREKEIAIARLARQSGQTSHKLGLNFKHILEALLEPRSWIIALMYFCVNVSFSSLSVFMPTIIKEMGYTSVHAQGLSAPPYILSWMSVIAATFAAARYDIRSALIIPFSVLGAVGYLVLAIVTVTSVRYFAIYLCAVGMFTTVGVIMPWAVDNQGTDSKKGTGMFLLNLVGQCGPLLGTRMFPADDAPYYRKGMWVSCGCLFAVTVLAVILRFYLQYLNSRLDKKWGPVESQMVEELDEVGVDREFNPTYRYIL
ncbi:major facilitator superfamily domain-containing protein [Lipomyces orientalis]|uniref:Major facilitator superfamily domain-containing protein n=1 Tax=Lipomyces orientalis TaxID=1233043 RepID=A0ACC3TT40_9ASCO